ncbi:MAG: biotin transporter BioY [Rhodoluna sp.]|nr:biotin transporter BioY [Rhodoluna sp.]
MSIAQPRNVTIIDNVISRSRVSDVVLVLVGVVLTALAAQVQIPALPVPFTLQTLAVLVIGATYGSSRGAITMGAYAVGGVLGFPVFAGGASGIAVIFGATGGFLLGFIFAAALIGRLAELNWSSDALKMFVSYVLGSAVIYAIGVPVLAMSAFASDLVAAMTYMLPYLIWDAVKAVIAAALLPTAWVVVKAIKK